MRECEGEDFDFVLMAVLGGVCLLGRQDRVGNTFGAQHGAVDAQNDVFVDPALDGLDPGGGDVEVADAVECVFKGAWWAEFVLVEDDEVGVAGLHAGGRGGVVVAAPVLDVDDGDDAVEHEGARVGGGDAVHFHGEGGGEGGAGGLDYYACGLYGRGELEEGVGELADEVAADAAVEEFAYAGDGLGGGELGVDG